MKAEILNGPRIFASRFSIWSRAVNTMGSKDLRSLGQTSRSRNNSTSQLEDISHRDSNLSVGCIFTVVMIFCPFLGMKTTDDMGRFPIYIFENSVLKATTLTWYWKECLVQLQHFLYYFFKRLNKIQENGLIDTPQQNQEN